MLPLLSLTVILYWCTPGIHSLSDPVFPLHLTNYRPCPIRCVIATLYRRHTVTYCLFCKCCCFSTVYTLQSSLSSLHSWFCHSIALNPSKSEETISDTCQHLNSFPGPSILSVLQCPSPITIRYDSVYLTCSKKLTGSQLSLPHGINKKIKCETKNEMMSVIGPVQFRYREAVQ